MSNGYVNNWETVLRRAVLKERKVVHEDYRQERGRRMRKAEAERTTSMRPATSQGVRK